MMDRKHHIPDTVLAAYAAGSLQEAYSVVVACHVSLCDTCRATLTAFEAVGGGILEKAEEAAMSADALDATMARIQTMPVSHRRQPAVQNSSVFPAPLQRYVGTGPDDVRWRAVGGGVKQSVLNCSGHATARLLLIPGGTAVPEHGHGGLELTLVLQGAFSDAIDSFARGDVEVGDQSLEHQPIAAAGEACICLAATDAPLRFKSFLPRLLQPLIGI